jgi:hypothetical protein
LGLRGGLGQQRLHVAGLRAGGPADPQAHQQENGNRGEALHGGIEVEQRAGELEILLPRRVFAVMCPHPHHPLPHRHQAQRHIVQAVIAVGVFLLNVAIQIQHPIVDRPAAVQQVVADVIAMADAVGVLVGPLAHRQPPPGRQDHSADEQAKQQQVPGEAHGPGEPAGHGRGGDRGRELYVPLAKIQGTLPLHGDGASADRCDIVGELAGRVLP